MENGKDLCSVSFDEVAQRFGISAINDEIISDIDSDSVSMVCCNKTTAACWTQM